MTKQALTIAGLDPSGGAGILADIETFTLFGVRPFAVVTALTGQNSFGVSASFPTPAAQLEAQLLPLLNDLPIHAIKIGMLGSAENVRCVARLLAGTSTKIPVVLDPVLCSSSGRALLDEEGQEALLHELMPLCQLVTPNLDELWVLSERLGLRTERFGGHSDTLSPEPVEGRIDVREAASRLLRATNAVLCKGGHAQGETSIDALFVRGVSEPIELAAPRVALQAGANVRGTGCRLASGIAARLALGDSLEAAVRASKEHLWSRLRGELVALGRGPALFLMWGAG